MNPFITVKLKCPDLEKAYDIEVPTNVNVGKLTGDLKEMVNAYLSEKHPMEGEDYCIISERLDRILWKNETLEEAGIRDGDTIVLEKRGEGPRIVGAVPDAVKEENKEEIKGEKKKIWEQLKGISRKEMAVIAAGVVFVLIVCIKSIIGGLDTTEPQSGGSSASASKETKTGGSDENDTDNTPVVYSLDSGESKTEDAGEAKTENTGESKTEDAGKSKTVEKPEPKPKKTQTTETENTEPQPTETETTKPETTEPENTEPETTEPETTEPAVVTPLIYDPSTVEDYSANLNPDNYHYYNPNFSDSHAKAFRFSYPSNLFNVAISDYSDFELYGGRNKETHTLNGSKGSVMLVGLYQRTGNDNLSLSDKVDQILDREGVVITERKNVIRKEVLSDRGYAWGAETGYGDNGSIIYIMTRVYDDYVMLLMIDSPYTGYHEKKDEDFYRKCYVQECIYKMCGFAAEDAGELRSYEEYLKDR